MKKRALVVLALLFITSIAISITSLACTENQNAKMYGGTMTVDLPSGKKLITATWKDADLWYLIRDAKVGEAPETHELIESSNFGIMEGKIIFKESR